MFAIIVQLCYPRAHAHPRLHLVRLASTNQQAVQAIYKSPRLSYTSKNLLATGVANTYINTHGRRGASPATVAKATTMQTDLQPLAFTLDGVHYARTISPSSGKPVHKAGPKFVSAQVFNAAWGTAQQVQTDAQLQALQQAPGQGMPSPNPVPQPQMLLAGVVGTAPAPSPANPFGALLALGTQAQATSKPARTPRTRAPQVNGVAPPQGTGACAKVWAICNAIQASGSTPTIGAVKAQAALQNLDPTTTQVQYYRWRKHQGITGRL